MTRSTLTPGGFDRLRRESDLAAPSTRPALLISSRKLGPLDEDWPQDAVAVSERTSDDNLAGVIATTPPDRRRMPSPLPPGAKKTHNLTAILHRADYKGNGCIRTIGCRAERNPPRGIGTLRGHQRHKRAESRRLQTAVDIGMTWSIPRKVRLWRRGNSSLRRLRSAKEIFMSARWPRTRRTRHDRGARQAFAAENRPIECFCTGAARTLGKRARRSTRYRDGKIRTGCQQLRQRDRRNRGAHTRGGGGVATNQVVNTLKRRGIEFVCCRVPHAGVPGMAYSPIEKGSSRATRRSSYCRSSSRPVLRGGRGLRRLA